MNRLLRMLKIVASCILVVSIVRISLDIKLMYVDRVTCFADVVRSSVIDVRNKMIKLDGCDEAEVASTFGGVCDQRFASDDLRRNVIAERQLAALGLEVAADCRYSTYRLPFIADYRGLMVVRSNANGDLLDYMIVYDGEKDEEY